MKSTPASRALAMIRCAVGSSVAPPNIMVPRQRGDTFSPLRPEIAVVHVRLPQLYYITKSDSSGTTHSGGSPRATRCTLS